MSKDTLAILAPTIIAIISIILNFIQYRGSINFEREKHDKEIAEQQRRAKIERLEQVKQQIITTSAKLDSISVSAINLLTILPDYLTAQKIEEWGLYRSLLLKTVATLRQNALIQAAIDEYVSKMDESDALTSQQRMLDIRFFERVVDIIQQMIDEA